MKCFIQRKKTLVPLFSALLCLGLSLSVGCDRNRKDDAATPAASKQFEEGGLREEEPRNSATTNALEEKLIYPGAQVTVQKISDAQERRLLLLETKDEAATVRSYYRNALNEAGWTLRQDTTVNDQMYLLAERENAQASISIAERAKASRISIALGTKE